jgi:hypothetical protein
MKQTSLNAYKALDVPTMQERVMGVIASQREYGATNYDACVKLKRTPNSISPRLQELEEMGYIACLTETRKNPYSGRMQNVYVDITHVNGRSVIPSQKHKSKHMEDILQEILERVDDKGVLSIYNQDELHTKIKGIL